MEYNDIKTPEELLKYMTLNIEYGFVSDDGKKYTPDNDDFDEALKSKWRLSSPPKLVENKYGICWDNVELERHWFKTHGYKFKTFYIWFQVPYENSFATHTYLVFEKGEKYYYFEYSDFSNRGIYEFSSRDDAIKYQRERFIEYNKQNNQVGEEELKHLKIYEYENPEYGCSMGEYIENILENAKEHNIDK